jgi:hypothetical protein
MHYNIHLYALQKKNDHVVHKKNVSIGCKCMFKLRNKTFYSATRRLLYFQHYTMLQNIMYNVLSMIRSCVFTRCKNNIR